MEELKKINGSSKENIRMHIGETLVVLDGTTGQNALEQARQFGEVADLTGIILTKTGWNRKGRNCSGNSV